MYYFVNILNCIAISKRFPQYPLILLNYWFSKNGKYNIILLGMYLCIALMSWWHYMVFCRTIHDYTLRNPKYCMFALTPWPVNQLKREDAAVLWKIKRPAPINRHWWFLFLSHLLSLILLLICFTRRFYLVVLIFNLLLVILPICLELFFGTNMYKKKSIKYTRVLCNSSWYV